nr:immunoglobulin light chain junction region [Macaca mulatta]
DYYCQSVDGNYDPLF